MNTVHKTVLLKETIDSLNIEEGDIVVDATLNAGGHSAEVVKRLNDKVKIIGIDADSDAIARAKKVLEPLKANVSYINSNFRDIKKSLEKIGIKKVNKFIFDLGLSSDQLEVSGRGFSFKTDEPLLMTFSKTPSKGEITAFDVVNDFEEDNLASIIRGFGEEGFAKRIASAIVTARKIKPIKTSKELSEIIHNSVPAWYRKGKVNPSTKTFQAIRIAVNSELDTLKKAIHDSFLLLEKKGRMAIISFHSLEDRIVKTIFRSLKEEGKAKLINKKPIIPTDTEIKNNKRSRSAKLRIIEKIK